LGEVWTVLKLLDWTAAYFREKGIAGSRLEAELLLSNTLGCDRVGLYLRFDQPLEPGELTDFRHKVARRGRREPVQYILGWTEFWSLPIKVTPDVLIPRADTEVLVEEALTRGSRAERILDVGTGSGAVAVALAHELPGARITAIDLSPAALAVAEENACENQVEERIRFLEKDLARLPRDAYDLIVSNPPYIRQDELPGLMPEVRDYEPLQALDGGPDGLENYRHLARQAAACLLAGGWLLVEIGQGQEEQVKKLFTDSGLSEVYLRCDYAGIPRVVGGKKT